MSSEKELDTVMAGSKGACRPDRHGRQVLCLLQLHCAHHDRIDQIEHIAAVVQRRMSR